MCTRSPVYRVRSFLPRTDVETLCDFLAGADDYDIDSDSVDAQPTFEFRGVLLRGMNSRHVSKGSCMVP